MKNLYTLLLLLCLFFLLISGSTIRISEYSFLSNPLFFVSGFFLVLFTALSSRDLKVLKFNNLSTVYFLFVLFGIMSSLINQDISSFMAILKLLFLYMCIVILMLNNLEHITLKGILLTFIASSILLICISLYEYPLNQRITIYSGFFDNSNSMGILAATSFTASFLLMFISNTKKIRVFYGFVLLFSIYLIAIAGSRTAFLTIFFVILISIISYFIVLVRENKVRKKSVFWAFLAILILFIAVPYIQESQPYITFQENILDKFDRKSTNITSSRTNIWSVIINEANLFGRGSEFLNKEVGLSAHNSFLAIVIEYGWIAGFFYLCFWIISLIKSFTYFINNYNSNRYSMVPVLIILNFILLSTMEVLTVHVSAILAIIIIIYISVEQEGYRSKTTIDTYNFSGGLQ